MAVNPITSDDLTINLSELLKLSVTDRVQAAKDPDVSQSLMSALTPIQMAKAFPDYYRKELPDISNFVLGGRYTGPFDQRGGGDYGTQRGRYGGSASLDSTVPRLPGKVAEKSKVDRILEKAHIFGTPTGKAGVTSAIKDRRGFIVSTADTSLTPNQRALLDTIAVGNPIKDKNYWESPGYNTIVGGGTFDNFSDHPRVFGTSASTAAGRYQFTKTTWDDVVSRYNKQNPDNPITDFNPMNQDRAALFLAEERYRNNTGRNLSDDLANPPENMGELIKVGLGQGPKNLTWEIFTMKSSEETGEAFQTNLMRNQGFLEQEIEAEAKKKEGINQQIAATPELMENFKGDEIVQKYFADNPEMANKVQEAINAGTLSIDDVSNIVKEKKVDSAVSATLDNVITSTTFIDQGGGVRSLPIPPDIKEKMIYAQERSGIAKVVSVSSGQIPWEEAEAMGAVVDPRTKNWVLPDGRVVGTGAKERHSTDVGAADLQFYDNAGNLLRYDDPRVLDYMKYAAAAGLTGIGAGTHEGEYMGPYKVHVGAGETGSWGGADNLIDQQISAGIAMGPDDHNSWREQKLAENKDTTIAETATATPAGGKTMLISAGTNDWGNEDGETTYNNLTEMAKQAQAKGYTPVIIAPVGTGKFQKVNDAANRAAADLGLKVEQPQEYDNDGYHPTQKEAQRIASLYPGATVVGDSIANRIGTYTKDGQTIATDGIQSGAILEKMNKEVAAAPAPVEQIPTYQFGGTPTLQDDEDLTAIGPDGKPRFKFNSGEGLYVKPEANEYADNKIDELSDKLDQMAQSQQPERKQQKPVSRSGPPENWAEKVAAAYRSAGSQQRAFNRAQFRSEGRHVGDRGSPNIS